MTCLRSCDMNAIGDACKFTMKHWSASWICHVTNRINANRSSFNS